MRGRSGEGGEMFGHRRKAAGEQGGTDAVVAELVGTSFFDGFTEHELRRVASLAERVDAQRGALLIDQGRVGLECYVILEGDAGVYVGDGLVATLGAGSMVGEMALIEHRPRNASVVAQTDLRLLAFDTAAFATLLGELPKAHERVMQLLQDRLRANGGI